MKNTIQILSILLIIIILIILIVKKYERFNNNYVLSSYINKIGQEVIEPNKCKYMDNIVVPNIIMNKKINRINDNISNEINLLLSNKTSLNSLSSII